MTIETRSAAPMSTLDAIPRRIAYATLSATYTLTFAAFLFGTRRAGMRLPERMPWADLALIGAATYKLSNIVTREKVASPIRAPFTDNEGIAPAGRSKPEPKGDGLRRAVGELITCPYCASVWIAAGLTYSTVIAPRPTRLFAGIFASVATADLLTRLNLILQHRT